MGMTTLVVM